MANIYSTMDEQALTAITLFTDAVISHVQDGEADFLISIELELHKVLARAHEVTAKDNGLLTGARGGMKL